MTRLATNYRAATQDVTQDMERTKQQQLCTAGPGNMLGCCLVSLHFLCYILCRLDDLGSHFSWMSLPLTPSLCWLLALLFLFLGASASSNGTYSVRPALASVDPRLFIQLAIPFQSVRSHIIISRSDLVVVFNHMLYWVGLKGLNVLLSRTQAGSGRAVKQEQEENSRNRVRTF